MSSRLGSYTTLQSALYQSNFWVYLGKPLHSRRCARVPPSLAAPAERCPWASPWASSTSTWGSPSSCSAGIPGFLDCLWYPASSSISSPLELSDSESLTTTPDAASWASVNQHCPGLFSYGRERKQKAKPLPPPAPADGWRGGGKDEGRRGGGPNTDERESGRASGIQARSSICSAYFRAKDHGPESPRSSIDPAAPVRGAASMPEVLIDWLFLSSHPRPPPPPPPSSFIPSPLLAPGLFSPSPPGGPSRSWCRRPRLGQSSESPCCPSAPIACSVELAT